jgi:small subunit ribosomal protein S30e
MPTHGSLTKAGKVRGQTPKIAPQEKKNLIPKARNAKNYDRRVLHPVEKPQGFRRRR